MHPRKLDDEQSRRRRRHVLVVGASQGLGEALVRELASKRRYCITIAGRNISKLKQMQQELCCGDGDEEDDVSPLVGLGGGGNGHDDEVGKTRILPLEMDVTDEESVKSGMKTAYQKFGEISVLVFNSGVQHDDAIAEWTGCESFRKCVEVNYFGAVHVVFHALPYLRVGASSAQRGMSDDEGKDDFATRHRLHPIVWRARRLLHRLSHHYRMSLSSSSETTSTREEKGALIVGISSLAGVLGCVPGGSAYASSKAGMDAFFESIGAELKSSKDIETLIFDPGSMDNPERQVG